MAWLPRYGRKRVLNSAIVAQRKKQKLWNLAELFLHELRTKRDVLSGVPDVVEKRDYMGVDVLPQYVSLRFLYRKFEYKHSTGATYNEFRFAFNAAVGSCADKYYKYVARDAAGRATFTETQPMFSVDRLYGDT